MACAHVQPVTVKAHAPEGGLVVREKDFKQFERKLRLEIARASRLVGSLPEIRCAPPVNVPKLLHPIGTGHIKRIEGVTVSQWKGKQDNW